MQGTIKRVVLNTLMEKKPHCRNNLEINVPFQNMDGHLPIKDTDVAKEFRVRLLPLSLTFIPPFPVGNVALVYQGALQSP